MNEITAERIALAYNRMSDALEALESATRRLTLDTDRLEDTRFIETAQGKITGKNAEEREGYFRLTHATMLDDVRCSARLVQACKLQRDLAQLELDEIGRIMRLMELTQADNKLHEQA